MAGYRQFHTKFWKDEWLIDLEPMERYLFSYLFTNELSSISGLYKLPLKVIINETGLQPNFINKTLAKFQVAKKIFYKDGVIWVVNMKNHHKNASPLTMKKVNNDIDEIGDCAVKRAYLYHEETGKYSIDTVSILNSESVSLSESLNKDKAEPEALPPLPDAYTTYENNIGSITSFIADGIDNWLKIYPENWIPAAIEEAVKNNARNFKYCDAILKRWAVDGFKSDKKPKKQELSQFEKNKLVAEEFIQEVQNGEI